VAWKQWEDLLLGLTPFSFGRLKSCRHWTQFLPRDRRINFTLSTFPFWYSGVHDFHVSRQH